MRSARARRSTPAPRVWHGAGGGCGGAFGRRRGRAGWAASANGGEPRGGSSIAAEAAAAFAKAVAGLAARSWRRAKRGAPRAWPVQIRYHRTWRPAIWRTTLTSATFITSARFADTTRCHPPRTSPSRIRTRTTRDPTSRANVNHARARPAPTRTTRGTTTRTRNGAADTQPRRGLRSRVGTTLPWVRRRHTHIVALLVVPPRQQAVARANARSDPPRARVLRGRPDEPCRR